MSIAQPVTSSSAPSAPRRDAILFMAYLVPGLVLGKGDCIGCVTSLIRFCCIGQVGARMAEAKGPVLVTGGAGYIGSHAVLALLDAGWPVAVIDDLSTGFAWAVPAGAAFVEGDIADRALIAALIAEHRIGAIMHFAGSVVVPESVERPLKYYENNTARSRALIDSGVEKGAARFIL